MKYWALCISEEDATCEEEAAEKFVAGIRSKHQVRVRINDASFEPLRVVVIGADGRWVKSDHQS